MVNWRQTAMKSGILIGLALFGLLTLVSVGEAHAQRQYRRYSPPAGPTITPYLNFFRSDVGVVGDPYNTFVAPRRQLDNQLGYMARQEAADNRASRQELEHLRKSEAAPTGTGAT